MNKLRLIPKSKRSQLNIQEMAFMLVAVVLFFGLVILFVMVVVYKSMYSQMNVINQQKTLTSLINLADSPEFRCVTTKSNCIDGDKVISLMNHTVYSNFWSFSSLSIIKLSAFSKNESEMVKCNFANYPDCDLIVIYDKKVKNERAISSYVAFCRKEYEKIDTYSGYTYDKCEIAKLVAGTELKNPTGSAPAS
ncbi:Uncharacterised protein [uncultured archaeon]|nr:Uncharacterised protein [uncultured archaeon]